MILILMVEGARAVISFCILSAMPGYMVVPPDSTVLAYRSFLISTSHFMIIWPFLFLSPPNSKCLHLLIGNCFLYLHSVHSIRKTIFLVVLAFFLNTGLD